MENQPIKKPEDNRTPLQKVATGTVTVKKKTGLSKFFDSLINDLPKIKDHVLFDIIFPAGKKIISDTVDTILYGKTNGGKAKRPGAKVSYNRYFDEPIRERRPVAKSAFDLDEFEFESRGDAEEILESMRDQLARYGLVSVADLYDICGITPDNPCVHNYGWTDLRTAHTVSAYGGRYIIRFPKPYPLD